MYYQLTQQRYDSLKELALVIFWVGVMWLVMAGLEITLPFLRVL